jgi:mannose-6-phosphate isomerase-like protein (cupin superfamily)
LKKGGKRMVGYSVDIEEKTNQNEHFREVLFTGKHSQLVVMTLQPGEEIGEETHDGIDQFIRVEAGEGVAVLNGEETRLHDGSSVVIPAGVRHNVINRSGSEALKLYTIYSPPEHLDGTIHRNKKEADEYEQEHHH